jgi:hypothetical protein
LKRCRLWQKWNVDAGGLKSLRLDFQITHQEGRHTTDRGCCSKVFAVSDINLTLDFIQQAPLKKTKLPHGPKPIFPFV